MLVFTSLTVFFIPLFIWLSLTYTGYNKVGKANSKRKGIYFGFLIILNMFYFVSNTLLSLNSSYGLPITILIILLFSMYMFLAVAKDKKSLAI